MNKLQNILSNSKSIDEKNAIIEPILEDINRLEATNNKLISEFLEENMVKRKKYFLNGHHLKWICWTHINRDDYNQGHPDLFHCEFRADERKSIIFKEYLNVNELYEAFQHSDYYKELVRESAIETVIG